MNVSPNNDECYTRVGVASKKDDKPCVRTTTSNIRQDQYEKSSQNSRTTHHHHQVQKEDDNNNNNNDNDDNENISYHSHDCTTAEDGSHSGSSSSSHGGIGNDLKLRMYTSSLSASTLVSSVCSSSVSVVTGPTTTTRTQQPQPQPQPPSTIALKQYLNDISSHYHHHHQAQDKLVDVMNDSTTSYGSSLIDVVNRIDHIVERHRPPHDTTNNTVHVEDDDHDHNDNDNGQQQQQQQQDDDDVSIAVSVSVSSSSHSLGSSQISVSTTAQESLTHDSSAYFCMKQPQPVSPHPKPQSHHQQTHAQVHQQSNNNTNTNKKQHLPSILLTQTTEETASTTCNSNNNTNNNDLDFCASYSDTSFSGGGGLIGLGDDYDEIVVDDNDDIDGEEIVVLDDDKSNILDNESGGSEKNSHHRIHHFVQKKQVGGQPTEEESSSSHHKEYSESSEESSSSYHNNHDNNPHNNKNNNMQYSATPNALDHHYPDQKSVFVTQPQQPQQPQPQQQQSAFRTSTFSGSIQPSLSEQIQKCQDPKPTLSSSHNNDHQYEEMEEIILENHNNNNSNSNSCIPEHLRYVNQLNDQVKKQESSYHSNNRNDNNQDHNEPGDGMVPDVVNYLASSIHSMNHSIITQTEYDHDDNNSHNETDEKDDEFTTKTEEFRHHLLPHLEYLADMHKTMKHSHDMNTTDLSKIHQKIMEIQNGPPGMGGRGSSGGANSSNSSIGSNSKNSLDLWNQEQSNQQQQPLNHEVPSYIDSTNKKERQSRETSEDHRQTIEGYPNKKTSMSMYGESSTTDFSFISETENEGDEHSNNNHSNNNNNNNNNNRSRNNQHSRNVHEQQGTATIVDRSRRQSNETTTSHLSYSTTSSAVSDAMSSLSGMVSMVMKNVRNEYYENQNPGGCIDDDGLRFINEPNNNHKAHYGEKQSQQKNDSPYNELDRNMKDLLKHEDESNSSTSFYSAVQSLQENSLRSQGARTWQNLDDSMTNSSPIRVMMTIPHGNDEINMSSLSKEYPNDTEKVSVPYQSNMKQVIDFFSSTIKSMTNVLSIDAGSTPTSSIPSDDVEMSKTRTESTRTVVTNVSLKKEEKNEDNDDDDDNDNDREEEDGSIPDYGYSDEVQEIPEIFSPIAPIKRPGDETESGSSRADCNASVSGGSSSSSVSSGAPSETNNNNSTSHHRSLTSTTRENGRKNPKKSRCYWYVLLILFLAVVLVGAGAIGVVFYKFVFKKNEETNNATVIVQPTPSETTGSNGSNDTMVLPFSNNTAKNIFNETSPMMIPSQSPPLSTPTLPPSGEGQFVFVPQDLIAESFPPTPVDDILMLSATLAPSMRYDNTDTYVPAGEKERKDYVTTVGGKNVFENNDTTGGGDNKDEDCSDLPHTFPWRGVQRDCIWLEQTLRYTISFQSLLCGEEEGGVARAVCHKTCQLCTTTKRR